MLLFFAFVFICVFICVRACCCGTRVYETLTLNFEEFSPQQSRVSGKKKEVKKQSNHMTCEKKKTKRLCKKRSTYTHASPLAIYRDARGQQMVRKKSAPIRSRAFLFAATDGETRNREDDDDAGKKNEIEELSEKERMIELGRRMFLSEPVKKRTNIGGAREEEERRDAVAVAVAPGALPASLPATRKTGSFERENFAVVSAPEEDRVRRSNRTKTKSRKVREMIAPTIASTKVMKSRSREKEVKTPVISCCFARDGTCAKAQKLMKKNLPVVYTHTELRNRVPITYAKYPGLKCCSACKRILNAQLRKCALAETGLCAMANKAKKNNEELVYGSLKYAVPKWHEKGGKKCCSGCYHKLAYRCAFVFEKHCQGRGYKYKFSNGSPPKWKHRVKWAHTVPADAPKYAGAPCCDACYAHRNFSLLDQ